MALTAYNSRFFDSLRLWVKETEWESEAFIRHHPQVVLIGKVRQPALGGEELDALILSTHQLILNLLEFAPGATAFRIVRTN